MQRPAHRSTGHQEGKVAVLLAVTGLRISEAVARGVNGHVRPGCGLLWLTLGWSQWWLPQGAAIADLGGVRW
jgi:hypothetical protein